MVVTGEKRGLKIDSSNIGMESARSYQASNVTTRRFLITEYQAGSLNLGLTNDYNGDTGTAEKGADTENGESVENSSGTKEKLYTLEDWQKSLGMKTGRVSVRNASSENVVDDLRQATVRYIFELLFARRRHRLNQWMEEQGITQNTDTEGNTGEGQNKELTVDGDAIGIRLVNMRTLTYSSFTTQYEREETNFSTKGTVKTSDGREISFHVDVGMSREFQRTFQEDLSSISFSMCDPLVINLDTDVAELSDQKFYFDIDGDGEKDEISQLKAGSGYLALDKNGDGQINDGSELFGTSSGDGFADLARYDEDGNGWIDENDSVWNKLQIWCKDVHGQDVLYKLADKGVGAICLQRASTDFALKNVDGQTNGAIRSTGVFLYENGNVGTMQHVDVAKYEQGA